MLTIALPSKGRLKEACDAWFADVEARLTDQSPQASA